MKAFTRITSPALIMRENRIDTDVIFPARYLLLMQREGLGDYLFHDRRYDSDGQAVANPVDVARTDGAQILITGADFGCGSSREQAVWTLVDFGITCVIGESFGEIFAANALRNGLLTITLSAQEIDRICAFAKNGPLTVDLDTRTICNAQADWLSLAIGDAARERLLHGLDETGMIQKRWGGDIEHFETRQRAEQPWLYEELAL